MTELEKNDFLVVSPATIIETAKEFQFALEFEPYDERPQKAAEAIELMDDPREIIGSRKIIVHALAAYVLYDGMSQDAEIYHNTVIADAVMHAEFSRIAFVNHPKLSSLALSLFNSYIISSRDKLLDSERIQSGVFIPVYDIESVWAAA